ncbi:Crp/Fnr family transcriptional regulator [Dysgonomonas sp. Marseille-P4361]|uniref:Crp/Fnr family transcriptional regulator n=1 Tax=Dysgonomonas sp. Marseille-P4361 TaxID=2161820 RepID=UPI000D555BBF|nr:Crp/Fnr family transcriptional regulator [Dysgonomonas sp. Marseille-P4361]
MKDNHIDILSHSDLFKGISYDEIFSFLDKNEYRIESYTKNDVFALAGDKVNYLMIVLEGELIARMVSDSGKYIQIDKIGEGRVVAPAMLFASNNVFPVNVIPDNNVFVLFMNKNVFLKAMLQNEILLYNFIQIVSDINRFLSTKIHSLSLKTIKGKLSEYILQQSDRIGGNRTITLTLTKQELADKFAIARPALSRSLSELEEEGLILVKGKSITILNRNKLLGQE